MTNNTCPNCGATVEPGTPFCTNCGTKLIQNTPVEQAVNTTQTQPPVEQSYQQPAVSNLKRKNKTTAGILHLVLGDIGLGNFYMGKIGLGILDLVFCWTGIPAIVGVIRGIMILVQPKEKFEQKYNVIAED